MNTDIDTAQITDAPEIHYLKGLSDTIYELAKEQLRINAAETKMQDAVEDAKVKYEAAIKPHSTRLQTLFASIANYAATAIDTLFPKSKGGERKKTYPVLGHKLQLRQSSSIKAPDDVIERINERLNGLLELESSVTILSPLNAAEKTMLQSLLRQPAPKLNCDAAKEALKIPALSTAMEALGIYEDTQETFKVTFKFTPESTKP